MRLGLIIVSNSGTFFLIQFKIKKKAGSYLLSRNESSIIGAGELDFRVRNGNGYFLSAMATGILIYANLGEHPDATRAGSIPQQNQENICFR